jgi:hypothetical protein
MFTHLKDGRRCWNDEGISIIQKRLEKEDGIAKYIDLKSLLEESLCAVGFEQTYKSASESCRWKLKAGDWESIVCLSFNPHDESIYFSINGNTRRLRDLFPLWGILRESYLKSKVQSER